MTTQPRRPIKVDKIDEVDLDTEVVLDARGDRITEARAEQMAEDFRNAHGGARPGAGRPSMSGGSKSPQITVRLPQSIHAELTRAAAAAGITVSKAVQGLIAAAAKSSKALEEDLKRIAASGKAGTRR